MIIEIGIIAGDIWQYLDEHSKCSLKDIVKAIGKDRELVLMSLGWLAREGHVIVEGSSPGYLVSLRKKNGA
ncbi:MAG: winged helix-turn-helix domain-containing protein [Candidatus Omnitrophota bacterium]